ncbi:MAG: efflux RND transporter periplasmic adaptor subunit [Gammaproteobacteria bacterium]|uniref:efflux RND transporter periplasmic adaptor subunit n=1 Tax=Hydrogenophaga sp. TaxID=1904254 RepID=UPI0025BE5809|nr:efflux RND transporter periplasmic adaptor subunit [Hydrogenophaga sp.]MBU4183528.1 efflux RND transporter periplasmic adaptor subunit [Gammaproteobacteria bacterium]MBU4280592.1 efflux RND transporter periplasmic adaptor subunit [Gammaproteobacteria bacterium]MBU4323239.1 efflux RND transporter periplasmic adaptor subunit [Gammaproteobacteria bacterium]MCG2658577.1 efflux RND transporter periplasmic adaptor subunit [Hydrogenophaga sp.]
MKTSTWIGLTAVALATLSAVGYGAWTVGMNAGMSMAVPQGASTGTNGATPSTQDPGAWTITQGFEATERHMRDGLKAGDVDPVTGLRILNYHDPMVPGKNFDAPGKSPFMDMLLVPRYAGGNAADTGGVTVSARTQQNLGLRTVEVTEGRLDSAVSVAGNVAWNERDQVLVSARSLGFVERLHVRATQDRVAQGAPLADIYVPSWVSAQEEYLAVARIAEQDPQLVTLRDAAEQRMRQAGMSPAQIQRVVRSGSLQPRFTLTAPLAGVVTELMVSEGATVMPGMALLRLQGTNTVWAEGQVPESQAAQLQPGTQVSATSTAAPGQTFTGHLQALLPSVDPATRTIKARLELANPQGRLVPGMFVQMRFANPSARNVLLLPSDAVIHTGQRSVVMLAEGEGRFSPVEVRTGREAGDQTEILQGLQAGQKVVRSGQFLIDSEASLNGLLARLSPAPEAASEKPAASLPTTHQTDALVEAVDGNTVTLQHPAIPALKWPAMSMDFQLPPADQRPKNLSAGSAVRIEFETRDGDVPQITRIEPAATGAQR